MEAPQKTNPKRKNAKTSPDLVMSTKKTSKKDLAVISILGKKKKKM